MSKEQPEVSPTSARQVRSFQFGERFAMKQTAAGNAQALRPAHDVSALEALLDYAIVEGTERRMPLFVCLLRLARMALKEEIEEMLGSAPEAHS